MDRVAPGAMSSEKLDRDEPRVALTPGEARRLPRFELERLVAGAGLRHETVASWLGVSRPAASTALPCKSLLSRPALEVSCCKLN